MQLRFFFKSYKEILVVVFFLAFFLRLGMNIGFQGINSPQDPGAGSDYIMYEKLAKNIYGGLGVSDDKGRSVSTRPPGVPYLVSILYHLFGIKPYIVRIFYSLFGSLTCVLLFFSAKKFLGENYALLAAFILAIYPQHFYFSMHFGTEVPLSFFLCLSLISYQAMLEKRHILFSFLFGLCMGFIAYIHPQQMLFPFFLLLVCFLSRKLKKIDLKLILISFITSMIVMAPWVIRNSKVHKKIVLMSSQGEVTFFHGHNLVTYYDPKYIGLGLTEFLSANPEYMKRTKTSFLQDKLELNGKDDNFKKENLTNQTMQFIRNNWQRIPIVTFYKIYHVLTPFIDTPNRIVKWAFGLSWGLLLPFVAIGIVRSFKGNFVFFLPLYSHLLLLLFVTILFFGLYRYRSMILPTQIIFATLGIKAVFERYGNYFIKNHEREK